jgi:flagellar basal-body rod modification protein FlgD
MQVEKTSSTPATNTTSSSVMNNAEGNMFMDLLLAQLKSQDPLAPTDANQFVSQLVEFNTLGEITKIREMVESLEAATSLKA